MSDQQDLFADAKAKIKEKKESYLSKLITKKQKFAYQIIKKRPKYILKSTNDMPQIMEVIKALETGEVIGFIEKPDLSAIKYVIEKVKEGEKKWN